MKLSKLPWIPINLAICGAWLVVPPIYRSIRPDPCFGNLRRVVVSQLMYTLDHDDKLPLAANWADATAIFVKDDKAFACPLRSDGEPKRLGHAYSSRVAGSNMALVLDSAVLLFDSSDFSWNAVGDPRQSKGANAAMADGSARHLSQVEIAWR